MSLLNLPIGRNLKSSARKRAKAFRPALQPYLEGLEQRTVLSALGTTSAAVAPAALQSPLAITGVNLSNLTVTGANTLSGTLNLVGNLVTKTGTTPITLPVPVQISLAQIGTTSDGCPILHLSLQIPDLNLLGLHVRLDNCNNGPVTVDITAIPSTETGGGLLGDLLCSVDNLLSGSGGLLNLGSQTGAVTGGLTQVLNGVLGGLVGSTGGGSAGGSSEAIPAGDTELVDLHLNPINLDVLGLHVTTSAICLNVFADPNGGLLGSLLSSLGNLLNNNGNNGHAANVLVRNILRDLSQLGL